jgi:hypothetical protein
VVVVIRHALCLSKSSREYDPRQDAVLVSGYDTATQLQTSDDGHGPICRYVVRYVEALGGSDGALQDLAGLIRAVPDQCGIVYARTR